MDTVGELLTAKGSTVHGVRPAASVHETLEMMARNNIGAVLVTGEDGKLHGIFSERDFARRSIQKDLDLKATRVKDLMTTLVVSVNPGTRIAECMALMTGKHIRHLPVMDGGRLIGLVSIGDVVKSLLSVQEMTISQQAYKIDQLETFISLSP